MLSLELMDMSGPRWKKGKDGSFAAEATANPMSSIVSQLQTSLCESKSLAIISGCNAILGAGPEQALYLNRAAFGRIMENADTEKQWFQLGPEEIFYLCYSLKCVTVELENKKQISEEELWDHMRSIREPFPVLYKAYLHLRSKNWVVRSGMQYGVDFVAYRHHPCFVHSEYAVVVVPEGEGFDKRCGRLKVWSDLLCALRASGAVAKTLLVLSVSSSSIDANSPHCLEQFIVSERTIRRWIPQQCREEERKPDGAHSIAEGSPRRGSLADGANNIPEGKEKWRRGSLVSEYWSLILTFTILSSLLVYKLKS